MRMDPRCKRLNELSDLYHQLFRQITERHLEQECRKCQLDEPLCLGDYTFLASVSEQESSSLAGVSKKLGISPSTATRQVNRLLANGLITKSSVPGDERRYEIRLTEKGCLLVEKMDSHLFETVQRAYENVTDSEMQTVFHYMEKCNQALQAMMKDEQSGAREG